MQTDTKHKKGGPLLLISRECKSEPKFCALCGGCVRSSKGQVLIIMGHNTGRTHVFQRV